MLISLPQINLQIIPYMKWLKRPQQQRQNILWRCRKINPLISKHNDGILLCIQ